MSRGDGSEVPVGPVGMVIVPKTGRKPPSPREDATEASVGRVDVPKSGQKPPSPRRDAPEAPVGKVAVPKTGQKPRFVTRGWL